MKILKNSKIIILLLCLISTVGFSQVSADKPIPTDPDVKIGKLANGLTYYIQKNPKPEKKVELRLVVNAGSILEDNDQLGLAHFMEHMSFNGSKHFPKNELVNYLQTVGVKFGADLNASTSFDETVYILPISSDNPDILEKGFTVLEDWAFNNLFDKNELEKERGVVLEESRLSKGSGERMSRQYFPKLFNNSKYAERLPIGKDSLLRIFQPGVLERFYRQWYRPDLMAVIVVGDIDPADIEKKIQAHFGGFKNPENEIPRPAIIAIAGRTHPEAMVLTDEEAIGTTLQIYNFVRPKKKIITWGDYRHQLVESLMSAMISGRLQELTKTETPPFLAGYIGMSGFLRGYEASVSIANLGDKPVNGAVDALISETEKARKFGFLESELARVKTGLLNQVESAYKERDKVVSRSIVSKYLSNFLNGTPVPGIADVDEYVKQVLPGITLDEINRTAQQMPTSENAFVLVTAPASVKDKLPTNDELLKEIVTASGKTVVAYKENATITSLMEKTPNPGKIIKETKNIKLGTTDLVLSNGITVTLKPTDFKNNEILMDGWRWGGIHKFDVTDKVNAENAPRMVMQMGVKTFSPTDISRYLTGKIVRVSPYINPDDEGIQGSSGSSDFETMLQLTYLYITAPRMDITQFNSYVNKNKSQVGFLKQNPSLYFSDTTTKVIFGNNPWASKMPDEQYYDQLNVNKVLSIYNDIYSNMYGMHFTFTGNIDSNKIKPMLEKYLASLPAKPKENTFKDVGLRPVKGVVKASVYKGKAAQSMIRLLFNGDAQYSKKEQMTLNALIEVLNIEVIETLREKMGGIYGGGFSGGIARRPYVHYNIAATVPCGPENVDKLTDALLDIIKNAKSGIDQKNLDKVKETWKKQYGVNIKNNAYWHNNLSSAWIEKNNPEDILSYETNVDLLTTEDLRKAAVKYFDMNNYVTMLLYPEDAGKK